MHDRKTYITFFTPMLLCMVCLSVWLFSQILIEQKQERSLYLLSVELSTGEIPKEVLAEMQKFPGLCRMWTELEADVEISAEGYSSCGKIYGVDLQTYPLKILKSGGQKAMGTRPLLVIGEDFLKEMTDSNGIPITARQAELLSENIGSLKAKIKLNMGDLPGTAESLGDNLQKEALQGEAEFLGVISGDGIYMDDSLMRAWLSSAGIRPGISRVCLEIRGMRRAEAVKKRLAEAGLYGSLLLAPKA